MNETQEMEQFLRVLELPLTERGSELDAIENAALRKRIVRLLQVHDELEKQDQHAPMERLIQADPSQAFVSGFEVDGYRILHEIGRGGMGVVFAAEQLDPPRRVALKTILGPRHRDLASRLEREARTLARLAHPGIAHVYGTGRIAAHGDVPFVVLELVAGQTLDLYLRANEITLLERLHLLIELCDAVGHAHSRGVVHRDLKPSNVMVDSDGHIKVLDFGIARILDSEEALEQRTHPGQVLGTLPYMSPESVGIESVEWTPRADVYALGVLCYEVMTGCLPIDLSGLSLASAARRIQEIEPRAMSSIDRSLRGDLELIVHTAMDKGPERRYADASILATELRRFLAHEPVQARRPTRSYLLRKFVRRHRAACAAALAIAISVCGGLTWALKERRDAIKAGQRTERALTDARARGRSQARMTDMLWAVFSKATPGESFGQPPSVEAVVDFIGRDMDRFFADDPFVLGSTHLLLFDVAKFRADEEAMAHHLERAEQCFEASPLTRDEERAQCQLRRARLLFLRSEADLAIAVLEDALLMAERSDGDPETLGLVCRSLAEYRIARHRDLPRARSLAERSIALASEHDIDGHATTPAKLVLARALEALDDRAAAQAIFEEVIEHQRQAEPLGSELMACALQGLGNLHARYLEFDDAQNLLEEALELFRRLYGDTEHDAIGKALDSLASIHRDRGQPEAALPLYAEAIANLEAQGGSRDLAIAYTERALAWRLLSRPKEAVADLELALEGFERHNEGDSSAHAAALEVLATMYAETERATEALPLAKRGVAMRRAVHGVDHYLVGRALEALGLACFLSGDLEGCELNGREAMRVRLGFYGADHWMIFASGWQVWVPLVQRGAYAEALGLLREADRVLALSLPVGHARHRNCLTDLANTLDLIEENAAAAEVRERLRGFATASMPEKR